MEAFFNVFIVVSLVTAEIMLAMLVFWMVDDEIFDGRLKRKLQKKTVGLFGE